MNFGFSVQFSRIPSMNSGSQKSIIPSIDEITEIINKLETGPEAAEELVKHLPKNRQGFVFRSFLWLLKLNILKVYR